MGKRRKLSHNPPSAREAMSRPTNEVPPEPDSDPDKEEAEGSVSEIDNEGIESEDNNASDEEEAEADDLNEDLNEDLDEDLDEDLHEDLDEDDLTSSQVDGDSDEEPSLSSFKTQLKDSALNVEANVKKSGVLYFSSIPPGMNVSKLREIMSQYGALGRIYLEPDLKGGVKRKKSAETIKHGQKYLEGWVEFKKKSVAKKIAACLNNSQVGGKRRAPYYESLWNIKYLNRFKWHHLTERLVHEKMTRQHRLRQEVAQAKRQTNFFTQNVEKSKILELIQRKKTKEGVAFFPLKKYEVGQRLTDEEIRKRQKEDGLNRTFHPPGGAAAAEGIKNVLANLFPKK